jgi:probable rRNA maturation factor
MRGPDACPVNRGPASWKWQTFAKRSRAMIDVAVLNEGWDDAVDWPGLANRATQAAVLASPIARLAALPTSIEIAIRLTSDAAVQALNKTYRGKDMPTNVLSFPMQEAADLQDWTPLTTEELLGDIVLAQGVCEAEAKSRTIPLEAHFTHLVLHGVLHLLGFDHIEDGEAEAMETLERTILRDLELHDPYED